MVTDLSASRAVWCSVCTEARFEFPLPLSPFDENQTAEVRACTEADRLFAATLMVAQPGTKITHYQAEMSQAQRAFGAFKGTPGQSFLPLAITLIQMKQYWAEERKRSHELCHISSANFSFCFRSVLQPIDCPRNT